MILNSMRLKEINVELIRSALKSSDFSTKNSIADRTGLSVATCRNILEELCAAGEAREIEPGPSTGGRPSRRFVYNDDFAFAALIYARMEGSARSLVGRVVNMAGKSVFESRTDCEDISLEDIVRALGDLLQRYPRIRSASLGVPGVVQNGVIGECDFRKLSRIPAGAALSEKFRLPVAVVNDVNATALGYYNRFGSAGMESLVYIYYPEEGIPGAGIVINGKVLKGRSDFAGEVSYMPNWIQREEQGAAQKNPDLMANYIVDTVLAINCLINPDRIILAGRWFTGDVRSKILSAALSSSPEGHPPQIEFESDIHDSYIEGLKFSGLEKLSCPYEVVEK